MRTLWGTEAVKKKSGEREGMSKKRGGKRLEGNDIEKR